MRLAWKFNDLKPRIYYSQGASAYEHARYIHTPFDSLQRVFPMTDPVSRYYQSRIGELLDHDMLMIYDYTTFTTLLMEIRHFTGALSEFLCGWPVRVLDSSEGIVIRDLGEILAEYNYTCNTDGDFDVSALLQSACTTILVHEMAGMLGIYGNIVESGVLHGLHLCEICGGLDKCNCIGDDALFKRDMSDGISTGEIVDQLQTIGDCKFEKTKRFMQDSGVFRTEGWHFMKRPIDRFGGRIVQGILFDPPNPALVVNLTDGYHTVPFESVARRRRAAVMQTSRFLDRLYESSSEVTDDDAQLALLYCRSVYHGLGLPKSGGCPGSIKLDGVVDLFVPPLIFEAIRSPWLDILLDISGTIITRLPILGIMQEEYPEGAIEGVSFTRSYDRFLGLLEDLGYLSKQEQKEDVLIFDEQTRQRLRDHLLGRSVSSYIWHFEENPPIWYNDTIRLI